MHRVLVRLNRLRCKPALIHSLIASAFPMCLCLAKHVPYPSCSFFSALARETKVSTILYQTLDTPQVRFPLLTLEKSCVVLRVVLMCHGSAISAWISCLQQWQTPGALWKGVPESPCFFSLLTWWHVESPPGPSGSWVLTLGQVI